MKRLLPLLLLASCAYPVPGPAPSVPPVAACPAGQPAMTAQLFFGRSIKGGGNVTTAAWQDFLAKSVTPRFPDGLTVLDGYGQWRNRSTNQISREASTVVEIVTGDTPATLAKLQAIRAEYRAAFHQESVGLVLNPSCASF